MVVVINPTDQKRILQIAKINHPLRKTSNRNVQITEKDHGLVVRQDVIIVHYLTEEIVMGGDQDLIAEIETDVGGQDQIAETEIGVGGQDQPVKKDADDHQDPVAQIGEVVTVHLQDNTEDHPQGEGLNNYTLY